MRIVKLIKAAKFLATQQIEQIYVSRKEKRENHFSYLHKQHKIQCKSISAGISKVYQLAQIYQTKQEHLLH